MICKNIKELTSSDIIRIINCIANQFAYQFTYKIYQHINTI